MTDEDRKFVETVLNNPDARVSYMRSVYEIEPKDGWKQHECGKTFYVFIAAGPKDVSKENAIRSILGHDPMSFDK